MWLDLPTFNTVVTSTPLVAIDLVVRNSRNEVLLGLRLNRPAYGLLVRARRAHSKERTPG
jgi:colanic acid biosynthesis protein WcaH